MKPDLDANLRERFRELRDRDAAAAPDFESVMRRPPSRVHRGRPALGWTAGGFALALAVGWLLIVRPPASVSDPAPDTARVALTAWPTHTDFLLADGSDSSQRFNWSPSPTSGLGQPTFSRLPEVR